MKYNINLIPKKEATFIERVVYFFLNYLRYIIVFTQLIVISVFFYRFQIDQRIIELREAVNQKKEIIQVIYPILEQMTIIEKQMIQVNKVIANQKKFNEMINYVISIYPAAASLIKLEIINYKIKMIGRTSDLNQLQAYYYLLKKENKFDKVILESVKKSDNGFIFSLVLENFKI